MTFDNNDEYDGQWQNDNMSGDGFYTFADTGKTVKMKNGKEVKEEQAKDN
jgi:hypothetical protein